MYVYIYTYIFCFTYNQPNEALYKAQHLHISQVQHLLIYSSLLENNRARK